jgi:flagella basal body P-ring formation protein FlgA
MRYAVFALLWAAAAVAADPVTIAVRPAPVGSDPLVTIGQAARLNGGDAAVREKMAKLDLIERAEAEGISRKLIRYRLKLAGYDDADFAFADAAVGNGALLSAEAVEEAARQELVRRLGTPPEDLFIDVVQGVAAKLPVATASDAVELVAVPNGGAVKLGRTQMNVAIKVNGERKLTVPVFLQTSPASAGKGDADAVVVKARQRVTITAKIGDLEVTAAGEAMSDGKVGQPIKVTNLDSKKVVSATVSGPGAVLIDLGGK